jgi:2-(3-amino-3-carboxypropyl)histidine synthase
MKRLRYDAIQYASKYATIFGIILGTLGRQGNPAIVQKIQQTIRDANRKCFIVLLSEITPHKLHLLSSSYNNNNNNRNNTLCWVQVACPRLSVDWGHALNCDDNDNNNTNSDHVPAPPILLNPYELFVCLEQTTWESDTYPMDYYSTNGGPWTNYHGNNKNRQMDSSSI